MEDELRLSDEQDLENLQLTNSDPQSYITNPQQFLDFSQHEKKIKIMDECNPIWNHVYLKDISLHKKGPLEDKIYAKINKFYRNIRRGNTLCQIYHPIILGQKQTYDIFFCRRGMKKFYDLQPEYLKIDSILSTHDRLMRQRIFQQLDADIEQGGSKIHLYRLFKQNGQHCQVSFVKQLDCWLFASKNVAILARTPEDLDKHYHKERFYWAKLVAHQFFSYLESFSGEQQQTFKKDIEGLTLLGQHCGNQNHQHITKYHKVEIIFYGLVDNVGSDHCQPVERCRQFLTKYGLKMSQCHQRKGLTDKNTIYSNMWEMLKQVAEGTMNVEGEGSVMYIVSQRHGKQRTIGMCKLKTSQYLIYRRLREMLKLNVARKGSTANTFDKYKFEIEELINHYFKPPKPIQFYLRIGNRAFKEAMNNSNIDENYLRYKFVDFVNSIEIQLNKEAVTKQEGKPKHIYIVGLPRLTHALQKYCKNKGYQIEYMYRTGKSNNSTTIHILYMIPRLAQKLQQNTYVLIGRYQEASINACIKQLSQCKDLSKSHLITFIKSEDKSKSVKMLNNKIQLFRQNCIDQNIPFKQIENGNQQDFINTVRILTEQRSGQLHNKANQTLIKYFVLPMVIPGSGKSTLAKQLLNYKSGNIKWKVIDSDEIRRELMQQISEVDLNSQSSQQLFIKTKDQAQSKFDIDLRSQINQPPSNSNQFVYVDRIFSPFNIQKAVTDILSASKSYVKIVVLTQTYRFVKLNDSSYPYSLNYLLICLKRCLQREDHQTMSNNPYEVAKIVLRFYQNLVNFNQKLMLKSLDGNISFVNIPLVEETEQNQFVNQHLKRKIEQCLSFIEPGKCTKQGNHFLQLVEMLYKFGQFNESTSFQEYYLRLKLHLQKELLKI